MSNYNDLKKLLDDYEIDNKKYSKIVFILALFRLISIIVSIIFLFVGIFGKNNILSIISYIIFSIFLIAFIILVVIHHKIYLLLDNTLFKIASIKDYDKRRNNNWKNFKESGLEFLDEKNYYENDLDVFSKEGLYKYLCVAKTGYGKRYLASILKDEDRTEEEIILNQEAVKELSYNKKFHIELEAALRSYQKKNDDTRSSSMDNALNLLNNEVKIKKIDVLISILGLLTLLIISVLTIIGKIHFAFLIAIILINFILSSRVSQAKEIRSNLNVINGLFDGYDDIIDTILKQEYQSIKLKTLSLELSKINKKEIKEFNILNSLITSGNNILFSLIFNGLFMLDTWLSLWYIKWQKNNASLMELLVKDVSVFEGLLSLSVLPLAKDNVCMPTISDKFMFENITHPLINEDSAIPNSFSFNGLNIITGSNMSGKTTFMRTIGLNYILFKAGGFVCANSFEAGLYKLFTSMKVVDDVSNGISTFYGEILRIKSIIDYIPNNKKMLVLIDEIFKGTNTLDRLVGAKEVALNLMKDNILAIITTHDFELCNIEGVLNYHFEEHYENDKILFDYKIKKGVSQTRNAIYLLKMAGIIKK